MLPIQFLAGQCNAPIYPLNYDPPCDAVIPRWTFNGESGMCVQIEYAACGQESEEFNVFEDMAECERMCIRRNMTGNYRYDKSCIGG